jgi:hypothetical protein
MKIELVKQGLHSHISNYFKILRIINGTIDRLYYSNKIRI